MTLAYETLLLPSTSGIVIATYLAKPGSPSADALDLLRSWSAHPHTAASDTAAPAERAENESPTT